MLVLKLAEPRLDHVAARYDADEPTLLDHRNMAELAARHPLHDFGDRFSLGAGHHLAGHRLSYGCAKHLRPFLIEDPDDIALRDDPNDAAIGTGDDQRPDAAPGQQLH